MRLVFFVFLFLPFSNFAQLICNAGNDFTFCPQSTYMLGGSPTASGGVSPYTYSWSPSAGLNTDTVANPILSNYNSPYYVLNVTDKSGNRCTDTVYITKSNIDNYSAGADIFICKKTTSVVTLGVSTNSTCTTCTFSWLPTTYLNNAYSSNPIASFDTSANSITYTLTITDGTCTYVDLLNVTIGYLPLKVSPQDTTIKSGEVVSIRVSGGYNNQYSWKPPYYLTIPYGQYQNPDAAPPSTIIYTVSSVYPSGCIASNTLIIHVIPNDELIFYNTFTPNNDGINDVFYIANLEKYPNNSLTLYNRYGQKIYFKREYKNDWDGTVNGEQVPTGTYFYVLDTGTDKGVFKGHVNIMR
ncbi:MAG: gliding motility-associated C-terminal domain-containing protein [Bacteroidia bacterium]|nr:gliding motility-associated C-terminal domain-containing protein [Bacteroidia bacterium]